MLGIESVLLLVVAIFFSLLLYMGTYVPWWLSVISGFMSFIFLVVLGLNWIGASFIPEAGWGFIIWGVINFFLSLALLFLGVVPGKEKTRFD